MQTHRTEIRGIPAVIWGKPSDRVYLFVHGKQASKEAAAGFAAIAEEKGYQTLSFDLPRHGERASESERCDIWNGMRDLAILRDMAFRRWREVSLYGCSLGAYFSLNAFAGDAFKKCLFQSPIVDMDFLTRQMMVWFGITEERLEREREIETPIDLMTWDYVRYVRAHPIVSWPIPTSVLYAGRDNLQSREVIDAFCGRFNAALAVSPQSEHPFMGEGDAQIVERWLRERL